MMHDTLAHALSALQNASKAGKSEVVLKPVSKVTTAVLESMKKEGYIQEVKLMQETPGGEYSVTLKGAINKVGVIKPRFSVKVDSLEKFEKRYLPAKDFGRIFLSTPKGVMTHIEAEEKHEGGVLLAYVY